MATRGRGGPPFRRGPFRRQGPRRRGPPQQRESYQDAEELGSREVNCENKRIIIEVKSNDQGRFMKIMESEDDRTRGRVIFSIETAAKFKQILDDFVKESKSIDPDANITDSERLKTETFNQGRRRYYVDLRQNARGRFLKLTMLAGNKTFVALPAESLVSFQTSFDELLKDFGTSDSPPATPPADDLPNSREVRAGGKTFFFDVERNDRGVFMRLSEVVIRSGRRTHINIPHSCWAQIGGVFGTMSNEMPFSESASGSGSEDEG